jgi:alpha-ketoglutarate-dependent taurine dioxygenase
VRTHPVTGRRSLFVNKTFTTRIVELGTDESNTVLDYCFRHIAENHDLQVRYRWGKDDVAIWDNRCTYHTATCVVAPDAIKRRLNTARSYDYKERRVGNRVVGIGEVPFFDEKGADASSRGQEGTKA